MHVSRSAEFIAAYLPQLGFGAEAPLAARLVHFTGYEMEIEDIRVGDPRDRMIGCMVGTADLIGQMSDRMYLEKCREFLYQEFVWGKIAREQLPDGREVVRYASPEDLIIKTPGFYEYVARTRIEKKLGARRPLRRGAFRRPEPLPDRDRPQHGFPARAIETADLNRLRRYLLFAVETPAGRPEGRLVPHRVRRLSRRAEIAGVAKKRLLSRWRNHGKSCGMASVDEARQAGSGARALPVADRQRAVARRARRLRHSRSPSSTRAPGARRSPTSTRPSSNLLRRSREAMPSATRSPRCCSADDEPLVHRLLAEPSSRWKLRAWGKDGAARHVELALGAVRSADGELTHWVLAFADRSEVEQSARRARGAEVPRRRAVAYAWTLLVQPARGAQQPRVEALRRPTSCTPSGRPFAPCISGSVERRHAEQRPQRAEARVAGRRRALSARCPAPPA